MPLRSIALAAATLALLQACATDRAVDSGDRAAAPEAVRADLSLTLRAARWRAGWGLAGADVRSEGGFRTTTDAGYTVTVSEGWLVDYSVTLVPCDEPTESVALRMLGIGTAHAHHGEFDDPSQLEPVVVEEVADGERPPVDLGGANFPGAEYCGVHWLLARGDADSLAPDGSSAGGRSLHLVGTWERDGEVGPIQIGTSLAQGMLRTIDDAAVEGIGDGATITIDRQLGTMFDGIDFATAHGNLVDWEVVSNLVEQATVSIECAEVVDGAKF